jgi:hypothetical protein
MSAAFVLVFIALPFLLVPEPDQLEPQGGRAVPSAVPYTLHPHTHPGHAGQAPGSGPANTPAATQAPSVGGGAPVPQAGVAYGGVPYARPGYQRRVQALQMPSHLDFGRYVCGLS